jgi:hypothetical protein
MLEPPAARGATQLECNGSVLRLGNGLVTTTFNLANGEWEALYPDGNVFGTDLKCTLDAEGMHTSAQGPRSYSFAHVSQPFGPGVQVQIERGAERRFWLVLTMFDGHPFFLIQVKVPNARGLKVKEVTLPAGKFYAGEDVQQVCALVNYWSGEWYSEIQPVELSEARNQWETYSHFYLCAYNRADAKSVILGALYSAGSSRIEAQVEPGRDAGALFLKARCFYEKTPLVVEQDDWASPPYLVGAPTNVFSGLESYGAVARAFRPNPTLPFPPTGWCSWDAGASSSQKELYANVDAMKAQRLDEYGLRYVQVDDGWQEGERCSGRWWARLDRFPDGMKEVADYIRAKGFVPGLWVGPFGEDSGQANQKALFANGKAGGYDLESPKFKEYLTTELSRWVAEWGFRYLKADFLTYGSSANQTIPYEVSFRNAVQIMEEAMRPYQGYLLTCINHEWLSVGCSDGQRLGNDVRGGDLTGLYPTLKTWPRRYFTNRNFWVGDPDSLHVNLPTDEQSQVWASFVALAGGSTMSGDNLTQLSRSRLEILKKALPAQGITARPCDLFERPGGWGPKFPRIWDCKIRKPGVGVWDVVGLFNWTVDAKRDGQQWVGEPQELVLDFARHLGLDPAKRYLVYDFWRRTYLGAFEKGMQTTMPPASCRVLVIREEAKWPQFLGDDRHIVNGTEGPWRVRWDADQRTLFGTVETVKDIPYSLAVHIPAGLAVASATANGQPANLQLAGDYTAGITFNTGPEGRVAWAVAFQPRPSSPEPTADPVLGPGPAASPNIDAPELVLRQLTPKWTDQAHDIEAGLIVQGARPDLGTMAPFRVCWDVSGLSQTHSVLRAKCASTGEGKVCFEVQGDGKTLFSSNVLGKGESEEVSTSIKGVRQLSLICRYVDGWFSSVRGSFLNPRLIRQ